MHFFHSAFMHFSVYYRSIVQGKNKSVILFLHSITYLCPENDLSKSIMKVNIDIGR